MILTLITIYYTALKNSHISIHHKNIYNIKKLSNKIHIIGFHIHKYRSLHILDETLIHAFYLTNLPFVLVHPVLPIIINVRELNIFIRIHCHSSLDKIQRSIRLHNKCFHWEDLLPDFGWFSWLMKSYHLWFGQCAGGYSVIVAWISTKDMSGSC